MRLELHAQDLASDALDVVNALGNFDAAALASAASVNLRLHHPDRATEFLRRLDGFLDGECGNATRNGHTKLAQDFLGLVFVNLHEGFLRKGISPVCHGEHVWRRAVDMAADKCIMLRRTILCRN